MKIGITGGIGSGKSTVSVYLKSLGESVICADETARQLTAPGQQGAQAIRRAFGDGFFLPDGVLDRKALAAAVFLDETMRTRLENILHPLIIDSVMQKTNALSGRVFVDAALLVQSGLHEKMDAVWLVTADKNMRIQRIIKRDGLSEQDVLSRISSQPDDSYLKSFADEVIANNGTIGQLQRHIDKLLQQYTR